MSKTETISGSLTIKEDKKQNRGERKPRVKSGCYYCGETWKYKQVWRRQRFEIENELKVPGEGGNVKEQMTSPHPSKVKGDGPGAQPKGVVTLRQEGRGPSTEFFGFQAERKWK